jgi:hypothetical protein
VRRQSTKEENESVPTSPAKDKKSILQPRQPTSKKNEDAGNSEKLTPLLRKECLEKKYIF